jgi:hypothetical protein
MGLVMTTANWGRCSSLAGACFLAALVIVRAVPASAQDAQPDPRWQAWVGCWEPAEASSPSSGKVARALLVCVVPAAASAAVDIVTVADTEVVSRERVEATGERRAVTRDGCTGWESAQWSPDGRRVVLRSEYACPGGLERRSSGLMAFSARGDWLDARSVTAGDNSLLRVLRYREAGAVATLPPEIAAALEVGGLAVGAARMAAAARLATADVVEASRQLDAAVVEAWLTERGQGFTLDGRSLVELADAGVPERVIDVMVALSYPRVFTVNAATRQGEFRPEPETRGSVGGYGYATSGWGSAYYSPYGWDSYWPGRYGYLSPYGYNSFGYSPYGYGAYGYGSYGYPGYGGFGGYYGGGGVIITVNGGGSGQAASHGRVVNGRGYSQGSSSSTDAQPRGRQSGNSSSTDAQPRERQSGNSSGTGSAPASGSGGTPSSTPSSGSTPSQGSGGGRTAHPRPPSSD